jgi:hypothetical protein
MKSTRPPPAYTDIETNTEANTIQVMPTPQASTSTLLPHPSRRASSDAHEVQVNAHPPIQNRRELQVQPQISSPRRQQQYPPQPQMSVRGGGDRNVENKPYNWRGEREWTKGLCCCFGDCGTCEGFHSFRTHFLSTFSFFIIVILSSLCHIYANNLSLLLQGCTACWCPCMTYSSNRSRRQALERNGAPHPEGGYSCGGDCLLFCFIHSFSATLCGWVLEVGDRLLSFTFPHPPLCSH